MSGLDKKKTWKEGDRSGFKLRGVRYPLALDNRISNAMKILKLSRTTLLKRAAKEHLDRLEELQGHRFSEGAVE